jgi:tetratricopeptide (TPR) repeat protein
MSTIFKKTLLVFCIILLSLFTLELMMWIGGFAVSEYKNYKNNKILKKDAQYTVVCIGESTTAGRYPIPLQRILDEKYPNKFSVIDCGVPGISIENILARLDSNINKYKPDIVVCMMSSADNNQAVNINKRGDSLFKKIKLYKLIKGYFLFFKQRNINKIFPKTYIEQDDFEYEIREASDLINQMKLKQAVKLLRDILKQKPLHPKANRILMELYYRNIQFKEFGDEIADKIVDSGKIADKEDWYELIFKSNLKLGDMKKLKIYAGKAIDKDSYIFKTPQAYILYGLIKDVITSEQKNKLIKLMELHNDSYYGFMAVNYMEEKDYEKADEYFQKADNMRIEYCNIEGYGAAYKEIIKKLVKNNIKVICMQYPMRSVKQLEKLLENETYFNNITFVSNETNFKNMLKIKKYDDIFEDQFAGDFGHCSDFGNILIAENVVESLSKLVQ